MSDLLLKSDDQASLQKLRVAGLARWITAVWVACGYLDIHIVNDRMTCRSILFSDKCGSTADYGYLVTMLALLTWLSFGPKIKVSSERALWIGLAVYLGLYLHGIIHSILGHADFSTYVDFVLPFVLGLAAARLCGSARLTILLICALVSLESVVAIYRYFGGHESFYSGHVLRASGTYGSPASLYRVILPAIPLAVAGAAEGGNRFIRAFLSACVLLLCLCLICTWYRFPIVAASVAIIYIVFKFQSSNAVRIMVAVLLTFVTIFTFHVRVEDMRDQTSSQRSVASRFTLWREGLCIVASHPVTGTGVTKVEVEAPVVRDGIKYSVELPAPHNQFLFLLDETGIIGFLLFLATTIPMVRFLMRSSHTVASGVLAAWISVAVSGLADTVFGVSSDEYNPANLMFGLMVGCTLMIGWRNNVDRSATLIGKPT